LSVGAADLEALTRDADRVMLFGITCGLSAPYVAGQIDMAMKQVQVLSVTESVTFNT